MKIRTLIVDDEPLARQRLRAQLDKTHAGLQKRPARDAGQIERRIGRWLGRFPTAERLLSVVVERNNEGRATGLKITEHAERSAWAARASVPVRARWTPSETSASWMPMPPGSAISGSLMRSWIAR